MRESLWILLGKRPLVPAGRLWSVIFRLNAKTVTRTELDGRLRELQTSIRLNSYFKTADRARLTQYYDEALVAIQNREAAKLDDALKQEENLYRERMRASQAPPKGLVLAESRRWRLALDVDANEKDFKTIKMAYRKKALLAHPDRGGSHDAMTRINDAYAAAKRELQFS